MKKNVFRLSVCLVCLSVVTMCLRFQSCSNIMDGGGVPAGYGRLMIAGSQRAITDAEVARMVLRYKFNGVDVTQGYMDFVAGTSVTIEVDGYVDGEHLLHHEEPPIVVHSGENVVRILLSKSRDELPFGITWQLYGGEIPGDRKDFYFLNDKYVLPVAVRKGYEFLGWYTDAEFSEEHKVTSVPQGTMGNLTFYAKWTKVYSITWELNGGNGGGKETYTALEDDYALPVPEKNGSLFLGWYTDETFAENAKVTSIPQGSKGNLTFYAKWTEIYNIVWETNGGSVSGKKDTYTAMDNSYVLPVPTKDGSAFLGWYEVSNFDESTKVTEIAAGSEGNKVFYAKWSVLGSYGETVETSHFMHVKDVQWGSGTAIHSYVKAPKYCFGLNSAGTYETTSVDLWTEGSYVVLAKNEGENANKKAGSYLGNSDTAKDVPTYTETVYTKNADGSYAPHVLADDLVIVGISEQGMMTIVGGRYGGFIYTDAGWKASNNGASAIYVDYEYVYPDEDEIAAFIASFRN